MFSYVGTVSQVVPAAMSQVGWRHMRTRLNDRHVTFFFLLFRLLYLALAIFLSLAVCTIVGVVFFPRNISVKLVSAFPKNISIPKTNKTDPFIIINVSNLDTMALDDHACASGLTRITSVGRLSP